MDFEAASSLPVIPVGSEQTGVIGTWMRSDQTKPSHLHHLNESSTSKYRPAERFVVPSPQSDCLQACLCPQQCVCVCVAADLCCGC